MTAAVESGWIGGRMGESFVDPLNDYVTDLVPTSWDRDMVRERKASIIARLTSSGFSVLGQYEAGSFAHGTGVRGHSDVDVMVRFAADTRPLLPSSTLNRMKSALESLGWGYSTVVSSPVVRISSWSGPDFEVAPAFLNSSSGSIDVVKIPGRADEWVLSAPTVHNALVNTQNARLSAKVKPLVRLIKMWKYAHSLPVSSFYLEMRVAEYCRGENSILYGIDMIRVMAKLVDTELRDMNDPSGITGRIPACASEAKRLKTLASARSALGHLRDAEAYRTAGDRYNWWKAMSDVLPEVPYPL